MSRQFWGCYAVADHMVVRPFVADVLLYERLVIPVPPEDDADQRRVWEQYWEPTRQERLLRILGEKARKFPWTKKLRDEWQTRWAARAADDVESGASFGSCSDSR